MAWWSQAHKNKSIHHQIAKHNKNTQAFPNIQNISQEISRNFSGNVQPCLCGPHSFVVENRQARETRTMDFFFGMIILVFTSIILKTRMMIFFNSAFLTLFRERQPPNGGCREPYLAEYDPSRRTTRDGRTDKKSFEKPYFSLFVFKKKLVFLSFS